MTAQQPILTKEVSQSINNIPPEKLKAMQDYARKLHAKFPHMKPARLQRKVAEEFKIKIV